MDLSEPLLWYAVGYLLGSIPFGLIVARLGGAGDVRMIGSGNIGATNVLRTGRKGLAAATLILDAAKAAVAVILARQFAAGGDGDAVVAGAFALVGHIYPVWLRFKGGKGVATMLGASLAALPLAGLAFALVWAGTAALTRISSLGGMLASVAAAAAAFALGRFDAGIVLGGMALLVLVKHADNIARLVAGTEPRIGQSRNG